MDFNYSPRTLDLQKQVQRFMDEHVYPAEDAYHAEIAANTAAGKRWSPIQVIEQLKPKARAQGLWNLFLPESEYGAGLTNQEYAPLADFSYHCMAWHIPKAMGRGIGGLDPVSLGIPTERDYVRRYCERTGRGDPQAVMADWNFYLAYNLFRIAAILQGIAKRVVDGTASSAQAKATGAATRPLARMAWQFAQAAG